MVLSASHDNGQTWAAPVRVNDDPPWWDNSLASVAVDGRGTVHVAWYGRSPASECGRLADVYWACSTDGGQTFGPARRVSQVSSVWDAGDFRSPGNVGEHLGIAASGSDVHVMWTQAGRPDMDVYHARIDPDTITATLLSRLVATQQETCVQVSWEFAPGVAIDEACVFRSDPGTVETLVSCVETPEASRGDACDERVSASGVEYRLRARFSDGRTQWFGPVLVHGMEPGSRAPITAQPNPFSQSFRIDYNPIAFGSRLSVHVLDLAGRRVAALYEGAARPGRQSLSWDGTSGGARLPSGVYFVEVRGQLGASRLRIVKLN